LRAERETKKGGEIRKKTNAWRAGSRKKDPLKTSVKARKEELVGGKGGERKLELCSNERRFHLKKNDVSIGVGLGGQKKESASPLGTGYQ